jgi:hypothetical protein
MHRTPAFPWRILAGAILTATGRLVFAAGEPERRGIDAARLVNAVNAAAGR